MTVMQTVKYSIRKNDQVQVIAGRENGKMGKVLSVDAKTGRVIVEKINMMKRHSKPSQKAPQGGIVENEQPLQYSNVLLVCPKCNRGVRHGRKMVEAKAKKKGAKTEAVAKQSKVRVCKRCDTAIDAA